MLEAVLGEEAIDERVIRDAAAHQRGCRRNVPGEPAAQIIENRDAVAARDQGIRHMGADEPGSARH